MGRTRKPRCGHKDCLTCPYDDCIATEDELASSNRGPGRPKLPPGVVKQHQLEYAKRHYQETKEQRRQYYKEYYQKNKERIHAQQKEYRDKRSRG
jgi:hypothetical protein